VPSAARPPVRRRPCPRASPPLLALCSREHHLP
jgi:hypothetical protein